MSIRTRVIGGNSLKDELKNLNKEIKSAVYQEIVDGAFIIQTKAKQNVPVDTGRLKTSIMTLTKDIKTYSYTDREGNSYDGKLRTVQPFGYDVYVGSNVEYAMKIHEQGGGGPFSGRTAGGQKKPKGYGRYYLKKAFEDVIPMIITRVRKIKGVE
jgi:hypothetical protein